MRKSLFDKQHRNLTLGELQRRFLEARERDAPAPAADEVIFAREEARVTQHERCGGGRRVLRKQPGGD